MKCPCCGHECSITLTPAGKSMSCRVCGYAPAGYFALAMPSAAANKCPACGRECSVEISAAGRRVHCPWCGFRTRGYTPVTY